MTQHCVSCRQWCNLALFGSECADHLPTMRCAGMQLSLPLLRAPFVLPFSPPPTICTTASAQGAHQATRSSDACDLLNDGFYHVARSLRDPTGLLDLLLDKVRFSFRADTLTSGPCTSYNQVPVFVFAAAASTHQAHLLCTSTLGALPRLAICGVS